MKLSTSTNILDSFPTGDRIDLLESLRICKEAGINTFDMNFCDNGLNDGFLSQENWQEVIEEIVKFAEENNINFSQTHLEFYNFCDEDVDFREEREELVRRGIIASNILGAEWAIIHPGTVYEDGAYSYEESLKANLEYFNKHLPTAREYKVGLAIENLPDKERRRFGGSPLELMNLVDELNDPYIGVCWDIGHANLMKINQSKWIKRFGKRIKAIHVNDNHADWDEHLAPYYGNVDWNKILKALREIGFDKDFTYEIHNFTKFLPRKLREKQLEHLVDLGNYMIAQIKS